MSHQVERKGVYFAVFGALMVLTALTVVAAFQNFGPLNDVVAMGIAITKAALVILFFMHVRHSSRLTKITVVSGFLWLALLFLFTLADYWTR